MLGCLYSSDWCSARRVVLHLFNLILHDVFKLLFLLNGSTLCC